MCRTLGEPITIREGVSWLSAASDATSLNSPSFASKFGSRFKLQAGGLGTLLSLIHLQPLPRPRLAEVMRSAAPPTLLRSLLGILPAVPNSPNTNARVSLRPGLLLRVFANAACLTFLLAESH